MGHCHTFISHFNVDRPKTNFHSLILDPYTSREQRKRGYVVFGIQFSIKKYFDVFQVAVDSYPDRTRNIKIHFNFCRFWSLRGLLVLICII